MNTKEKILEAALNIFSVNGYGGTSIRNIAKEVGVRESAIYNHFKSKDKILETLIQKYGVRENPEAIITNDLFEKLKEPETFFLLFAKRLIHIWGMPSQIMYFRIILIDQFREDSFSHGRFTQHVNELRSIMSIVLSEMIKNKIIRKSNPQMLANEFVYTLIQIRIEYLSGNEKIDWNKIENITSDHIKFFWNAVKN
ncbi:MAG: TetR/AcrR family transcriptional regulator [Bacteroidetes bacterium]|nr:TetR/AcrR family transcriptional regulator [Bacteroidota bacterium]MBU1678457.1 TetR/AcrR family transcriptional regulator [Bacteroidota bacterium]